MEQTVLLELQAQSAQLVLQVQQEHKEFKVLQAQQAQQVLQEQLVMDFQMARPSIN